MYSIKQPPTKTGKYFLHTPKQANHAELKHKAHYDAEEQAWSGVVQYWLEKATHWTEIPAASKS